MRKLTYEDIAASPRAIVPAEVREWAERNGLPPIWQLGVAVADMGGAMAALETLGCTPFLDLHGKPTQWIERGEARRIRGHLALAYKNGMEVELLGPEDGTTFYSAHFDPSSPVLHHVGILTHELSTLRGRLEQAGIAVAVHGIISMPKWIYQVEFLYMDTRAELGLYTELIDYRIAGIAARPSPALVALLGRAQRRLLRRP